MFISNNFYCYSRTLAVEFLGERVCFLTSQVNRQGHVSDIGGELFRGGTSIPEKVVPHDRHTPALSSKPVQKVTPGHRGGRLVTQVLVNRYTRSLF